MSPYLSPKNAIAPSASASSLVVSKIARRRVGERLGVGQPFDLEDLLVGHGVVVAEVEAEPVGADHRAGLLHVLAEHLAQRVVQQVGGGVVAADRGAPIGVDRGGRRLPRRDRPRLDARPMATQVRQREGGVEHDALARSRW